MLCDEPRKTKHLWAACLSVQIVATASLNLDWAGAQERNPKVRVAAVSDTKAAFIGANVPTILNLRAVGAPMRLDDGRLEQRYEIVANVAFTIEAAGTNAGTGGSAALGRAEWSCGGQALGASKYSGAPGSHGEIRMRIAGDAIPLPLVRRQERGAFVAPARDGATEP